MALSQGLRVGVWINGPLDRALVQGSPLQAIWSCKFPRSATNVGNADNWSLIEAREVIPQPQLQPITSKEIRRCLQFAQSSRAPRKPFIFIARINLQQKSHCMRVSPIVFKIAWLFFIWEITPHDMRSAIYAGSFPKFDFYSNELKDRIKKNLRGLSQQQLNVGTAKVSLCECC